MRRAASRMASPRSPPPNSPASGLRRVWPARLCADWYTSAAGGTLGLPNVRITVRTTDGALVLIRYTGRVSTPTGRAAGATSYVTPVFETGDQRCDWLNHVQAVGKGRISLDARRADYVLLELR
jgi:hypothetical protein